MGSNPSGSRPNFFGRQHLTFDKGGKGDSARQRDYCTFAMVVRIEGVDATEAIPPVAARILSGDSTSPLTRDGHGCLKSATQSRCTMQRH